MAFAQRTFVFAAFTLALGAASVASAALSRTQDPAEVQFFATGPGGLKIVGKTSQLQVVDDGQTLKIFVPLATLDTSIELRNRHMRDKYLHTDKFPNAELQVAKDKLRMPSTGPVTNAEVPATLTLHGKSRPVTVSYDATAAGKTFDITGRINRLNMRDFDIEQPKYLGVEVKPEVDIKVHFRATDS